MAVKQACNLASVGMDPSDVAACREGAELGAASECWGFEQRLKGKKVELAVVIETDFVDLSQALSPREEVRVVLVGAEEDDPPLTGKKGVEKAAALRRRNGDAHYFLEPLNGRGAARTAEQEGVVWTGFSAGLDVIDRLLHHIGHMQPQIVVHCVGVTWWIL